jgi:hypothetical protein
MMNPTLSFSEFVIPVSPGTLGVALIALFLFWLVFSLILRYHWKKYAASNVHVLQMTLWYFGGSVVLWACVLACYLMYVVMSY